MAATSTAAAAAAAAADKEEEAAESDDSRGPESKRHQGLKKPLWEIAGITEEDISGWEKLSRSQLRKRMRTEARRKLYDLEKKSARIHRQQQPEFKGDEASQITKRRRELRRQGSEKFSQLAEKGPRFIIDCDFHEYMTDRERRSMYQQLALSYNANKYPTVAQLQTEKEEPSKLDRDLYNREHHLNATPAKLIFTGLSQEAMDSLKQKGATGWEGVYWSRQTLEDYMETEKIPKATAVYLTADAPDTAEYKLESVNTSRVYIIGGIIDRNRYKGLTLKKAQSLGIPTAKLPINDSVRLIGSPSLTTNHGKSNRFKQIAVLSTFGSAI
eukprot:gb/GECG01006194.1/.p1 GENE.gb/GECG01006194.1/~~gb/GECG01006194.1/.p1  ORF type:complete len:328 (+),score=52.96 gb/GECG01006194.1/:1-984(+)